MKMKLKPGYLIQKIAGENILITGGSGDVDFSKMLVLNDSATMLVQTLIDGEVSVEELVNVLVVNYNVEIDLAKTDVEELLNELKKQNILEETV